MSAMPPIVPNAQTHRAFSHISRGDETYFSPEVPEVSTCKRVAPGERRAAKRAQHDLSISQGLMARIWLGYPQATACHILQNRAPCSDFASDG